MIATNNTVNELSGTIDLPSTMIRAEALFRRFQRTVEAVDRKHSFPTPSNVRQRKPRLPTPASPSSSSSSSSSTAGRAGGGRPGSSTGTAAGETVGGEGEKIISPELRELLSRRVAKLDKKEVKEHGGGIGS